MLPKHAVFDFSSGFACGLQGSKGAVSVDKLPAGVLENLGPINLQYVFLFFDFILKTA